MTDYFNVNHLEWCLNSVRVKEAGRRRRAQHMQGTKILAVKGLRKRNTLQLVNNLIKFSLAYQPLSYIYLVSNENYGLPMQNSKKKSYNQLFVYSEVNPRGHKISMGFFYSSRLVYKFTLPSSQ